MPQPPLVIRLSPALLAFANPWPLFLLGDPRFTKAAAMRVAERFSFKNDEKVFVREMLFRKSNLWIFRCDQQGGCGDFVIVDMASPSLKHRSVAVLDLKQGAALKIGGGGAGVQFRNAAKAVAYVAARFGVIETESPFALLSGDREAILGYWGVVRP